MKNIRSAFSLFCLSVLLVSCSTFIPLQQPAQCLPDFPYQDGWYGGDGAYSIALDERRTLWIFGDTFVSEDKGRKDRIGMDVVLGTTLAVSTCSTDQKFSIQYFLKKKNGKFVSSFGQDEWLWPQDPFIARGTLYIPLLVIQGLPDAPPPFNFKVAGHKIARIKDFKADDPHQWPVDYLDWTHALATGVEALATTSVIHHNYVYFYPLYRYAKDNVSISGNILARISTDHLDNPANYWEYWTRDGAWQKKLKPNEVKIIFPAGVSELSVRYHIQDQQWMVVYLSPEKKGHQLLYSTAANPEGPWSPPSALIEAVAEVDPRSPIYDQHTFCYAGKEHRQFAQDRNLVVTYVCNSSEDISNQNSFLRKNLFLYRPVVKNIQR
ncbi:MAG: DUF4185 domain-containing protein [Smithellaceae bacterium]|nr:DUF4185 domain-containing protein [Smithellaceae bacterium]